MNDLNYQLMIMGELLLILIILLVQSILEHRKLKKLKEENKELYKERKQWLSEKSKLSMIEFKLREYKEQKKNPVTILRDIQEIMWKEDK